MRLQVFSLMEFSSHHRYSKSLFELHSAENELNVDCTTAIKKDRIPPVYWALEVGDTGFKSKTSSLSGRPNATAPIPLSVFLQVKCDFFACFLYLALVLCGFF